MHAHLIQSDICWENREENHRRVREQIGACASIKPGDLLVLPELFDTGFSFRLEVTADRDGRTLRFLRELAAELRVTIQGSRTVMGEDGRGRNRASVVGPTGEVLVEYDKIHPFSFGREGEFFSGGDNVVTYTWKCGEQEVVVCPAICYDLRFPELFRRGMKMGAEVFALGANWPSPRAMHRSVLAQARAIENQAYFLSVNRAGSDPHLTYSGGTAAFGPKGEELGLLPDGAGVLSVAIEPAAVREWRKTFPACRDAKMLEA